MKHYAKEILIVLDVISYLIALFQLFVQKDIEYGVVQTLISLILNLYLFLTSRETLIKNAILEYFSIEESEPSAKKQFTYFCIAYIGMSILLYVMAALTGSASFAFINIFILPCIFSIFMLYLKVVFNKYVSTFIDPFYFICAIPHILFFMIGLFSSGGEWGAIILLSIAIGICYIPTYLACKLIDYICRSNK